jgi:hypothetical protein
MKGRINMQKRTYRAEFFTAADYAVQDFEARTPQEALRLARRFYDENCGELDFRSYDDNAGLDHIQIWDSERGTLASWDSDDHRLRKAAGELRIVLQRQTEAALAVIASWENGDLAAAVRALGRTLSSASATLAKTEPGPAQSGSRP